MTSAVLPQFSTPLVDIQDVWKIFGGTAVLQGINLTLQPGEIHALLGGNGAGKSTLMKTLAGLYRPDRGEVHLMGQPVVRATPALIHQMGLYLVPQESQLFPNLSVYENVTLRLPRSADLKARLNQLMELLDLQLDLQLPARYLDVAQQQLVEILRGLMRQARVLILDEPTSSLTPKETERLFTRMRRLSQDGVGIFFISHKLHEIREICDTISVLRDGAIVLSGQTVNYTDAQIVTAMTNQEITQSQRPVRSAVVGVPVLQVQNLVGEGFGPLSFDLYPGEVLGVAGVLGSGRTELAETLVGLRQVESGQVRVAGQLLLQGSQAAASQAGMVYLPEDRQHQGLFLDTSIAWNISSAVLNQESWFLRQHMIDQRAQRMIDELAIRCQGEQQILRQLSGGNQQKALIAKCLACQPKILLLDEPTRGVDVVARNEIYHIVDKLAADGVAVLVISSDFEEITRLADRTLIMRYGSVTSELAGEDISPERIAGLCFEKEVVSV